MKLHNSFFIFLMIIKYGSCANILAIFTVPSRSHSILGFELFKELARSGHEVIVISPEGNELKNPPQNYTNIVIGGLIKEQYELAMNKMFNNVDKNPATVFIDMINTGASMTEFLIKHDKVQKLLKSKIKFDLVITEIGLNEAVLGFSEYYQCPHISLSTVGATSFVDDYTRNPSPFSYIPNVFIDLTDKMTFVERIKNTVVSSALDFLTHNFHYTKQKEIYDSAFPNSKNFRPFWEKLRHGVSLVLLNTHYSVSFPRPYLPNLIEVGGMHIKKKTDPIPEEIKKFIDESESVIYFSLGSNLSPSIMAPEKQQAIIKSLSKVKERVLWKWDDENVAVDKSKFLVKKWFPQDDLLAHPKIKLFITHGGLLSGTESIYYGKPLLVIPIFGDQKLNAARTVSSGFGVKVDYNNLTEESLTWAMDEMLSNPKYTIKVKELSERFKDRPQHPLDLAKFFVEYVIKHKGVPFMQSSSKHLNFIQLYNIDVMLTIFLTLILGIFVPFMLLKKLLRMIFGSKKEDDKKLKKN